MACVWAAAVTRLTTHFGVQYVTLLTPREKGSLDMMGQIAHVCRRCRTAVCGEVASITIDSIAYRLHQETGYPTYNQCVVTHRVKSKCHRRPGPLCRHGSSGRARGPRGPTGADRKAFLPRPWSPPHAHHSDSLIPTCGPLNPIGTSCPLAGRLPPYTEHTSKRQKGLTRL
jgi:hypothetical protein